MNLMFQPQFEAMILAGRKPHTVRPVRRRPLKVGQQLSLRVWTGKPYRSKQREFAKAKVIRCESFILGLFDNMIINHVWFTRLAQDQFAWADGFKDADDMRIWFGKTHSLPFVGTVIYFQITP